MQGCAFAQKPETRLISLQDMDRPHLHLLYFPILPHISEFKSMLFRRYWGCWPPLPCSLHSLYLFFLHDLLLYILLGTLHHVQQTDSVTESCCSSFVRATKCLHWHCELTSPRWPPGRSCQATQGDSWAPEVRRAHGECSAAKWRKASHGWDSFILIKWTIKLMWLQRC